MHTNYTTILLVTLPFLLIVSGVVGYTIITHTDSMSAPFFMAKANPIEQLYSAPPATQGVFGWIPYWDQPAAIASFQNHPDVFDYIGVFWYVLRDDGSVALYPNAQEDLALIDFAKNHNVKVLALIANLPAEDEEDEDWDAERVARRIGAEEAREQHIADIIDLLDSRGFDGVLIDYEVLGPEQEDHFTAFIQELSSAAHERNKIVGVALHPKSDSIESPGSEAQHWGQLAKYADQLHVMSYEEHWDTSSPGAPASVPWFEEIYRYARMRIPPDKLFAGIPLYGYDWPSTEEPATGITYADVVDIQEDYEATPKWDRHASAYYMRYSDDGAEHTVWYEDTTSVLAKLELLRSLHIGNVVFWRLGGEDERVWDLVEH